MIEVINNIIKEIIRDITHITLIIDIKKREACILNLKAYDNTSTTTFPFAFGRKIDTYLSHTVIQFHTLSRVFG